MYILLAILMFSILIFVHELGHFMTAKLCDVQVNEFSMFMGPAIWKKQIGETLYSIRTIPVGGYCAMEGEDEESDNPRAFNRAAWWKRLLILLAGAAMNFLFAVLVFAVLYLPSTYVVEPVVSQFTDCCTFNHEDGLMLGDEILSIDGETVYLNNDISLLLGLNTSGTHDLVIRRNGQILHFENFAMTHTCVDENGDEFLHYGFGFGQAKEADWSDRFGLVKDVTLDNVRNIRLSLQMLFTGKAAVSDMAGVVGIVDMMSDTAEASESTLEAVLNMFYFCGFLGVNLAVMNLLPIPALDGGRAVCLLLTTGWEKLTKKKLNPKYEGYLHAAGMIFLLALMALITFKDIFVIIKG